MLSFFILQDEITLLSDPDSTLAVITSSYEFNLVFNNVFFGQYQQFYAWQTVEDFFGQTA
jgi:hypothetical protein